MNPYKVRSHATNRYDRITSMRITGSALDGTPLGRHTDIHLAPMEDGWKWVIPHLSPEIVKNSD